MIKIICLALIAMMLVCGMVFADSTSTKWFHAHEYLNKDSYADKYNEYERTRRNPLGLGLDITVYEFEGEPNAFGLDSIEVQNKFDLVHKEYSGYLVGKVNINRAVNKVKSFLGF